MSAPRLPGKARVTQLDPRTMHIRFEGHASGAVVEGVLPEVKRLLSTGAVRGLVIDAAGVTGFTPDVSQAGRTLLGLFVEAGVKACSTAVSSGAIRMIGTAIGFAAGLPIEFVSTDDEAQAAVRRKLAAQPSR